MSKDSEPASFADPDGSQVPKASALTEAKNGLGKPTVPRGNNTRGWRGWINRRWWNTEFGHSASPQEEAGFCELINDASSQQENLEKAAAQAGRQPRRHDLRAEIASDVVPFYLLKWLSGSAVRKDFINVRSQMWQEHVETFARIKHNNELDKVGSTRIDYARGHLDILDTKFGVLLQLQSLIGVVVSVSMGAFKSEVFGMFNHSDTASIAVIDLLLGCGFLASVWSALALLDLKWMSAIALGAGSVLLYFRGLLPESLLAALMVFFSLLWFSTTLLCLRGAGRARWGGMKGVDAREGATTSVTDQLKNEQDYQLNGLIRALVGRTALYRTAVLLVFTNLYTLVAVVYVSALVLRQKHPVKQDRFAIQSQLRSQGLAAAPRQGLIRTLTFLPGKTCDGMPDLDRIIENIAHDVLMHKPAKLVITGSADAVPLAQSTSRFGNNAGFALSRGYCIAGRIRESLGIRGVEIPTEIHIRDAQDRGARSAGSANDRTVSVALVGPVL